MFSIRSITNLSTFEEISAGSLTLFAQDGDVLKVEGQDPSNPLFVIDSTTGSIEVNGTFSIPEGHSLPDGTLVSPSLAFTLDGDTGLYRPTENELGMVAGGVNPVIIKLNEISYSNKNFVNVGTKIIGGGSAEISLDNSELPTATVKVEDQKITGIVNSVDKIIIQDANIEIAVPLSLSNGTVSTPAYSFKIDSNTGMYYPANNQLGFTINNSERFRIESSSTIHQNKVDFPDGVSNDVSIRFNNSNSTGIYHDAGTVGIVNGSSLLEVGTEFISMSKGIKMPTFGTSDASYTLLNEHYLVRAESSSDQTFTLPSASSAKGQKFIIFKTEVTGTVTINTVGGDTIDGALTSIQLRARYDRTVLISDGITIWITI